MLKRGKSGERGRDGEKERRSGRRKASSGGEPSSGGFLYEDSESGRLLRRSLVVLFAATAIFIAVFLLIKTVSILLLFFGGVLLAVLFEFFSGMLERHSPLPHSVAVILTVIVFLGLISLMVWFLAPRIAEEVPALSEKLQDSLRNIEGWLSGLPGGDALVGQLSNLQEELSTGTDMWSRIAGVFSTTIGALSTLFLVFWVGTYLAYSPKLYSSGFLKLVPPAKRNRVSEVISTAGRALKWWLFGQLVSMVFLGVTTWLILIAFGISLPVVLALLAGVLSFIPYIGPLISLIPILLLSFLNSPLTALYVFLLMQVAQIIQGNIILTTIYEKTVKVPPALTILSQLIFGTLFGLPGILLATPLIVVIIVFVRMIYVEDMLGEKTGKSVK